MSIEELKIKERLAGDFSYFSAAALKVVAKDNVLKPMLLNNAQRLIEKEIRDMESKNLPVRVIIVKARQLGASTYTSGRFIWKAVTKENQSVLQVAHEVEAAQGLLAKTQGFYDNLPDPLKPKTKYRTKAELYFEGLNSSYKIATANNPSLGRSRTFTHVHLSEVAFWGPKGEQALLSVTQAVPNRPNTSIIIESTSNGFDNAYADLVDKAMKKESDYRIIFLGWSLDPEYAMGEEVAFALKDYELEIKETYKLSYRQLRWRRYAIENLCQGSEELFAQEYPLNVEESFLYTGRPCFSLAALTEMRMHAAAPEFVGTVDTVTGELKGSKEEELKLWSYAVPGQTYVLGVDTAEGVESKGLDRDYSAIQIINARTLEQVGVFRSRISVDLFPHVIIYLAKMFNNAYIVPEVNNHGLAVVQKLRELRYHRIYRQYNHTYVNAERTEKIGFTTTKRTKPMIIGHLAELIREKSCMLKDTTTLGECSKFSQDNRGRLRATTGHDDTVMALALAYWGVKYSPVQVEITKSVPKIRRQTIDELFAQNDGTESDWVRENFKEAREV